MRRSSIGLRRSSVEEILSRSISPPFCLLLLVLGGFPVDSLEVVEPV